MGRRDYRHREPKKSKKDAKKTLSVLNTPPPMPVEVIRKRKERKEPEVEEEE